MSRWYFSPQILWVALIVIAGLGLGYEGSRWWKTGASSSAQEPSELEKPPLPQDATERQGRHALLIGVTYYENLEKAIHLDGPENDMLLMKELLTKRYGFPEANVRILSEHAGRDNLPTRKNIERAFKRLATAVQPGDQVVIVMGGHGSLQPQSDKTPFPQPDGCDRIFLPRDVGKWDGDRSLVANAIRGDEIGAWLRPIPDKKASVFVVLDACHSGSGVRAVDEEKKRQLDPQAKGGLEIPKAARFDDKEPPGPTLEVKQERGMIRIGTEKTGRRAVAQLPSLFDFTKGRDDVLLQVIKSLDAAGDKP